MTFPQLFTIALSTALGAQEDVASTIVAMERAALDRSDQGDPRGFLEISDTDVVYFDPSLDKPIRGLEALRTYYSAYLDSPAQPRGEMTNVNVQVVGDVAVLTFNYLSEARQVRGWNTTEVYRRTPAGWRIIHTHWAYHKAENPL